jgi:UDP-N-acetylmuramyl tripeptide synthase
MQKSQSRSATVPDANAAPLASNQHLPERAGAAELEWLERLQPLNGVRVQVDYARHPAAYAALEANHRSTTGQRIVAVLTAPADRREADLREIGKTCARAFHALVVYESGSSTRPLGETARVILQGAREEDATHHEHHCKLDVHDAVRFGLNLCREGDVLVVTCIDGCAAGEGAAARRGETGLPRRRRTAQA